MFVMKPVAHTCSICLFHTWMTQIKNPEAEMAEAAEAAPACKLEIDQSQNAKFQGRHPIGYLE